jgi:uncharacterized repeat protein (TIGR01451 family)
MTSTSNPYVLTMNSNHNVAVDLGFYEADLAITASGNPAAISPTGQVTYTLTMTNNGALSIYATTTIPDVVVTDTLPPGMAYVSSSWSGGACAEAGGTVTCNLGTVASGASRVITIVAEPSSGLVAKTVTNTATVSSVLIAGNDTVPANNTASVSTTISSFGAGAGASNGTTSSAAKGSTNVPMVQLVTMATGTENMKITKITVQASGSGNDALDITSVKLYLDVNGNGIVDAGDTLLSSGTFTADNGTLDLTLSSALTVTAGTPQNLLVTYDINTTLAKVLPFTGFSLLFLGMIAGKRSRRWMLLLAIGVFMVWFHGCSGGGGGGDAAVTSPTNTTATLASLSVTPANPTLNVGSTQQFTATGMYSDSTTKDLTSSAVWASSNPAVATITATGMATVISAGTTTVTATSAGIANSTVITGNAVVAPAVPTSTYQVSIIGITAKGATSNQPIVLPGLPVMGTTVSVVK